ncbi:MAG: DUF485 domain-containing protein [Pseudomonadota bacterium]
MTESGRGDPSPIDPRLTRLLQRRSRWRWSLSTVLIGAYLGYGVGGVYFPDAYAKPIMGTSLPSGLAFGYVIIFVSIILSALYVRVANRLEAESVEESSGDG